MENRWNRKDVSASRDFGKLSAGPCDSEALDRNGNKIRVEGSEMLARAICHEMDHLTACFYRQGYQVHRPQESGNHRRKGNCKYHGFHNRRHGLENYFHGYAGFRRTLP